MNAKQRRSDFARERWISRSVLVLGVLVTAGLFGFLSQYGVARAVTIPGGFYSVLVGVVAWFGRSRSRERWEGAWDAYVAEQDGQWRWDASPVGEMSLAATSKSGSKQW